MADFLVEAYVPNLNAVALAELVARLEATAEAMSAAGPLVRHRRSIHVPKDETCFHLFEATSVEAVREAGRRAGLEFDRVTPAVEPGPLKGEVR